MVELQRERTGGVQAVAEEAAALLAAEAAQGLLSFSAAVSGLLPACSHHYSLAQVPMVVRLLLSIDRSMSVEAAQEVVPNPNAN